MVGMTRFERATPSSQARCATKLRHIPNFIGGTPQLYFKNIYSQVKSSEFLEPFVLSVTA